MMSSGLEIKKDQVPAAVEARSKDERGGGEIGSSEREGKDKIACCTYQGRVVCRDNGSHSMLEEQGRT